MPYGRNYAVPPAICFAVASAFDAAWARSVFHASCPASCSDCAVTASLVAFALFAAALVAGSAPVDPGLTACTAICTLLYFCCFRLCATRRLMIADFVPDNIQCRNSNRPPCLLTRANYHRYPTTHTRKYYAANAAGIYSNRGLNKPQMGFVWLATIHRIHYSKLCMMW